jgi:hypothetical protein
VPLIPVPAAEHVVPVVGVTFHWNVAVPPYTRLVLPELTLIVGAATPEFVEVVVSVCCATVTSTYL